MPPDAAAFARRSAALDVPAIGLSLLCLIHCLALPALIAIAPALAVFAENEWAHKALVAVALPLSGFAIWRSLVARRDGTFVLLALAGLALLVAAAFFAFLSAFETPLTVAGALMLALAHVFRWRAHRRRRHDR